MSIVSGDIKYLLSGGGANTDPNAAIGGAISATDTVDNVSQNLFDNVSAAEAASGDTEYRCVYIKNTHATLTWGDARFYRSQASTSSDDEIDVAVAAAGVSSTETAVANENTAPASVTFAGTAVSYATGLALNSTTGLAPAAYRGVWIKRVVNSSAAPATGDNAIIKAEGTTT